MELKLMPDDKKQRKKIFFLFNSFITLSGGDVRLIEVAKRISSYDKIIITSPKGKNVCEQSGLDAKYLLTAKKSDKVFENVFLAYFFRIVNALLLKMRFPGQNVLYSSSDFLPDVLPAFVLKNTNKNFRWVQQVYHLISPPSRREEMALSSQIWYLLRHKGLVLI
jgi:hypothetical protein